MGVTRGGRIAARAPRPPGKRLWSHYFPGRGIPSVRPGTPSFYPWAWAGVNRTGSQERVPRPGEECPVTFFGNSVGSTYSNEALSTIRISSSGYGGDEFQQR